MQQVVRRRGGADNHIGFTHGPVQMLKGSGFPTQFLGQRQGPVVGTVGHYQVAGPGGSQGPAGQLPSVARADEQHPFLRQVAQQAVDEPYSHVADGAAAIVPHVGAQLGIVVNPPSHSQGLVEQAG